jgi:hypothetical protein
MASGSISDAFSKLLPRHILLTWPGIWKWATLYLGNLMAVHKSLNNVLVIFWGCGPGSLTTVHYNWRASWRAIAHLLLGFGTCQFARASFSIALLLRRNFIVSAVGFVSCTQVSGVTITRSKMAAGKKLNRLESSGTIGPRL